VLAKIAKNDNYDDICRAAAKKLEDITILDSITFNKIKKSRNDFRDLLSIFDIEELIDIAKRNPEIMKTEWRILEERVRVRYVHTDYTDPNCCHGDCFKQQSSGLSLPPYPF
jgi:hypothetical protein